MNAIKREKKLPDFFNECYWNKRKKITLNYF